MINLALKINLAVGLPLSVKAHKVKNKKLLNN